METAELAFCKFGRNSGNWLESAAGEYAVSSQAISLNGKPGGEYVIAARVNPDGSVPGLEPTGRDVAGTPTGYELPGGAFVETWLSSTNRAADLS